MTIWTFESSSPENPYWSIENVRVVYMEDDDGKRSWRYVSDGKLVPGWNSGPWIGAHYKGKPLEQCYWPRWFSEMNDCFVDEGI